MGRYWGKGGLQYSYLIVIYLFDHYHVTPDTGEMMRLLLWALGSTSEMQEQCLPVQHWRHWLSVGDPTEITQISSRLPGPCLVG